MNKIRDAFEGIHADTQMKETTKQFLAEKYEERQKKFFRPVFKRAMPVVCVLLLFLIGVGGYSWIQAPAAYVSIDINPSIELVLNRFDKVLSRCGIQRRRRGNPGVFVSEREEIYRCD